MAATKKRVGGARSKIAIDPQQVERLGQLFCTVEEMAVLCRCDLRTMQRRIAMDEAIKTAFERGKALGRIRLRRRILQHANSPGSAGVAASVYLAKHILGQTDKAAVQVSVSRIKEIRPMIILTGAPPTLLAQSKAKR